MNIEINIAPINEDLNVAKYKPINIKNLIYYITGKQVMLDSDVAMLYYYETKRINESVSRNKERFPDDFCFQLTEQTIEANQNLYVIGEAFKVGDKIYIGKPQDKKKTFIVTTKSEEDLVNKSNQSAMIALVGGIIAIVIGIAMFII